MKYGQVGSGAGSAELVTGSGERGGVGIPEVGVQLAQLARTRQGWRHCCHESIAQAVIERRAGYASVPAVQIAANHLQVRTGDVDAV